ncbi:MAG: hypothetical protein LRY73_12060 [Bacillus sp. (in: Bacteria)]|nr:hypothetical protein [Bacillus sp. (in: firmicutes)]
MKESLKVVDVQFSRGEPEVSVLLFYKDLDGEEKAGWYVISNQMEHFEIYDTIQAQHDEPVFQVTEKIMEVYERFAENYSDDALIGLTAEEFVMLYAYTSQLEDYETLYELHILDEEKYTFLDKEQYLQEMKESSSKTFADTMENEVLAMYQVYFDEETDDGFVRLVMKDNLDFPGIFRLTFEEGVWKSHWLPTQ